MAPFSIYAYFPRITQPILRQPTSRSHKYVSYPWHLYNLEFWIVYNSIFIDVMALNGFLEFFQKEKVTNVR